MNTQRMLVMAGLLEATPPEQFDMSAFSGPGFRNVPEIVGLARGKAKSPCGCLAVQTVWLFPYEATKIGKEDAEFAAQDILGLTRDQVLYLFYGEFDEAVNKALDEDNWQAATVQALAQIPPIRVAAEMRKMVAEYLATQPVPC